MRELEPPQDPQTIAAPVAPVCDPIHMYDCLIGDFLPAVGIHVTAGLASVGQLDALIPR
jgi:hypothetical protein